MATQPVITGAPTRASQTADPYARSYRAPVLAEIEKFLRTHPIPAARFGTEAIGDPNIVMQIRAGRDPRSKTVAILRRYMEETRASYLPASAKRAAGLDLGGRA